MSTLEATLDVRPTVIETFSAVELPGVGSQQISYDQFSTRNQLNASSTPPATMVYAEELTGPQNLDLTALARSIGGTIDTSGLKLQAIRVINLSTTDLVDIEDGAANAYQLNNGDAIRIPAGGELLLYFNDKLADVDGTHKMLDVTPAGGEDVQVMLLFG